MIRMSFLEVLLLVIRIKGAEGNGHGRLSLTWVRLLLQTRKCPILIGIGLFIKQYKF
jgi:hypothetical protein